MIHANRPADQPAGPLFDAGALKQAADARAAQGIALCRSCGREIIWAKTETGRNAPFDARPITVYVVNAAGIAQPLRGRVSHFATCPHADRHRAKG